MTLISRSSVLDLVHLHLVMKRKHLGMDTKQITNPASHIECFTKRDTRSCLLNIFRTPPSLPSFPGRLPKSASDSYLVISLPFCPQRNCSMFALVHAGRDRLKGARMCGCITDLLHAVELLIAVLV